MLALLRQIVLVSWQSLLSIPARFSMTWISVVGTAGVVIVFVAILSIATGFKKTLNANTSTSNIIVLRAGSSSEMDSGFSGDQVTVIKSAILSANANQDVPVSAELYVVVDLEKKVTQQGANVPLRGVSGTASEIRKQFNIASGRYFEPGKRELIAGLGATAEFSGVAVGDRLTLGQDSWEVVGTFSAGQGVSESELWTDARILQSAYRRGDSYSAVYARLIEPESLNTLKNLLAEDPRVSAKVLPESEYYAQQSDTLYTFISVIGGVITLLMGLAAVFGALNTMYIAVSMRSKETATLRAMGFSNTAIVFSVLAEALLLGLIGGIIGCAVAYLIFNGVTVSTLNFASFSQIVFAFAVSPNLLVKGLMIALMISLVGGAFPALRAVRVPVAQGLRE